MILTVFNPYTVRREVATTIGTPEGTNGHSRPLRINMLFFLLNSQDTTIRNTFFDEHSSYQYQ
jgi:hypothetical protein